MKALEEAPKEENKKAPKKNVDDNSTSNAPEEESGFTLGDILGKDIDNDSEE